MPFLQGCAEFTARFPIARLFCSQPKKIGKAGSILFSVRAPVGKINIADRDYIIGRGLSTIKGREVIQDYLEQFLKISEEQFRNASQGSTFEVINSAELANWSITLPESLPEQTQIAAILSTIDRAIEQTEAIIAKQQRIKTGLMQDLLTRGIDAHGNIRTEATHAFKDSPLGRIPVEWEVVKLTDCYAIPARNGLYKPSEFYGSGLKMIHMPQMFKGLTVDSQNAVRVQVDNSEIQRFGLQTNDLLFARRSLVLEGAGLCTLVPKIDETITFESSIIRVRLDRGKIEPKFAAYFLRSEAGYQMRLPYIRQVAVSGVSGDDVGNFLIPMPNIVEQCRILDILDALDIEQQQMKLQQKKLVSTKTGLMQDLLTGRVRVGGVAL